MKSFKDLTGLTEDEADSAIISLGVLETRMSNKEFDNVPVKYVVRLCRLVHNSKITSRFLERWLSNHCNSSTLSPNKGQVSGNDFGDLLLGEGIIGRDNIELKSAEKDGRHVIGGGQLRLYENIPFYLFLQFEQGGNDHINFYLLSKQQLHDEIFKYKIRCSPSQVSGQTTKVVNNKKTKISENELLKLIQETFDNKNKILWGFNIDSSPQLPKTPKKNLTGKRYLEGLEAYNKKIETLTRWNNQYKISLDDLKNWSTFVKEKYEV